MDGIQVGNDLMLNSSLNHGRYLYFLLNISTIFA